MPDKTLSHMLRARGHAFQLPTCVYNYWYLSVNSPGLFFGLFRVRVWAWLGLIQ